MRSPWREGSRLPAVPGRLPTGSTALPAGRATPETEAPTLNHANQGDQFFVSPGGQFLVSLDRARKHGQQRWTHPADPERMILEKSGGTKCGRPHLADGDPHVRVTHVPPKDCPRSARSLQVHWRYTSGHESASPRFFCDWKYTPGSLAVHKPVGTSPRSPVITIGQGIGKLRSFAAALRRTPCFTAPRDRVAGGNRCRCLPAGGSAVPPKTRNGLIEWLKRSPAEAHRAVCLRANTGRRPHRRRGCGRIQVAVKVCGRIQASTRRTQPSDWTEESPREKACSSVCMRAETGIGFHFS
jgi:hypothetical protein